MPKLIGSRFKGKATGTRDVLLFVLVLAALSQLSFHLLRPALAPVNEEWGCRSTASGSASPLCAELALFKSWEVDSAMAGMIEGDDQLNELLAEEPAVGTPIEPLGFADIGSLDPLAQPSGLMAQQSVSMAQQNQRQLKEMIDSEKHQDQQVAIKDQEIEVDMTAWGELWALRSRIMSRISQLRLVTDMVATMDAGPEAENATSMASELMAQQRELENRAQILLDVVAPNGVQVKASSDSDRPLAERIAEVGKELCSHPERRAYPACVQFLQIDGSPKDFEKVDATIVDMHGTFDALSRPLSWSAVTAWKEFGPRFRGVGPTLLAVERLPNAHWAGMIPKVACVSVIPTGVASAAQSQMSDFIDNFLSQRYEGPRQLVIVYHHADRAAAELVSQYADGSFIRGAAAFGDPILPSATAFRFGAYVANADIIARWDFGSWHHPQRLSLQVRALAQAARPAVRLRTVTERNGTVQSVLPDADEASLVGEKEWMTDNWRPLLGEVSAAHPGRQLVELEMPELIAQQAK